MKWLKHPAAFVFITTSLLATIPGCNAPTGDANPGEVRPSSAHRRPRPKSPISAIPIIVVKAASPTAFAKGKKAPRPKTAEMPADTSIAFNFSIVDWPAGANSVDATIKCYQVSAVYTTGNGYQINTVGNALPVFGDSSTEKNITIYRNTPTTAHLTFSSSTCLDKQFMVGVTGWDDIEENEYGGGEIIVVTQ